MMETIKVNMTPCEDIKTIHASQNDNEAREWGFELHNNGEKIDSSSISDQLVFKSYKGGTEQILPENGSTPTTSPFLGDIKYPQGLLTDQEFLYRESPTEEDGLAKITDIKGNTLNWNQLAENGNFADGVGQWTAGGANTLTVTNGVCKIQSTNTSTNNHHLVFPNPSIFQNGHTYLLRCEARAYGNMIGGSIFFAQQTNYINIGTLDGLESLTSAWQSGYLLFSRNDLTLTNGKRIVIGSLTTVTTDDYFELKNICVFDLTQMGLDSITEPSEFVSLFPLPYYSYNTGTLLSFNGTGIKTTGNNLASGISQGAVGTHGETTSNEKRLRVDGFIRVFQGEHYTFTATSNSGKTLQIYTRYFADANGSEQVSYLDWLNLPRSVIIPSGVNYATFTIRFGNNDNITLNDVSDVQIEHGTSATDYEPYTSSTLSLPISTYFPNGMKSAGNVYDELTEIKAITRIGIVDLGSLTWVYEPDATWGNTFRAYANYIKFQGQLLCPRYQGYVGALTNMPDMSISATNSQAYLFLRVKDSNYTDATAFKQAMTDQNVKLYYELATPTETSFTTASLVTENAEIPLSNEDGVLIGKCTEQLSENPGFFDAKIKLADDDGECYSNKIQLHV